MTLTPEGHVSIDTRRLVAEIEEEVRRKRASGDLPADFERELDNVFAKYAPVGAQDLDFDQVLAKIDEATVIDTIAPADSSRPIVPKFKVLVRKAIGWYIRWVANQVSSLVAAISRALHLLGERVDALEAASPGVIAEARTARTVADLSEWVPLVTQTFRGVSGRVLHGEAGVGELVSALVGAGVDGYGIEPDDDVALEAASRSLDVRADDVVNHLALLDNGSLAGLVLSGCVDRAALGGQLHLLDLAASKLAAGGTLIVLGTDPAAWSRARSSVQADLSPGRPLHAETWATLLAGRGFAEARVEHGAVTERLAEVPADTPGADAINANLALLNDTLFRPSSFAVIATRRA